jgi:NAD(P)H-dependent FMN reductase
LPSYCEDDDVEQAPAAVRRLRRTIAAAATVLLRDIVAALVA